MLLPPSADWAEGPPASASAFSARRPDLLPPELEARLRRQRAQQYGLAVRESLAAAHARLAARRGAAAAVQRESWEAQRGARLARLAERQQVQQQQPHRLPAYGTAAAGQQHPVGKDGAPARRGGAENTSPASLLRDTEQPDAKPCAAASTSSRSTHGASRALGQAYLQQRLSSRQHTHKQSQQAAGKGERSEGGISGIAAHAAPPGASPPAQVQAQHPTVAAASPADPLEQLLRKLLAAEGAGDPHSIINLYVAEQLQAAASWLTPPATCQLAQEVQGQAAAAAGSSQAAVAGCSPPAPLPPQAAEAPEVHVADAAAEVQQWLAPGLVDAQAQELLPLKEQPSVRLQPSESAPSTVRHRRSSSLMLPLQFDAAAADEPAEWSIAAMGMGGADVPPAAAVTGLAAGMSAVALLRQQAIQRQRVAATDDTAPLGQPQGSSKQLYVQQWLQRSAAEVAPPEWAPAGSSLAYSEDPDHASAQLEALPSLPSPAPGMAEQPEPDSTAANGGMPSPSLDGIAAAVAHPSSWAAAVAAPSGVSVTSRSASAVTSARRPGAPEPPSSSSQQDGGSSVPSRGVAAAGAPYAAAGATPAALVQLPEEHQLHLAADDRSLGSSSWDGRSGAEDELQAALSFSHLQAVAAADGAAWLPPEGSENQSAAAAGAADEGSERSLSQASHSSELPHVPAAGGAAHVVHPVLHPVVSPVAAATGAAAAHLAAAAAPAGLQSISAPSFEAYSSDFDSEFEDAEISYGDLGAGGSPTAPALAANATGPSESAELQTPPPAGVTEAADANSSSRPSSPRLPAPALWQTGGGSPHGSAGSPQRPRSPHNAALDDRYPGSPPASGGSAAVQLPVPGASYSRPHSPASRGGSPQASGDGGVASRPTSPGSAAARSAAAAAEAGQPALQQEDTVVVLSPDGSSDSGSDGGRAGSPYSLVRFGAYPAGTVEGDGAAGAAAGGTAAGMGSPPGTPGVAPAGAGGEDGSCPGSARVLDDTVVQTEEHNRAYLQEVLGYFLHERAEAFAAGAAQYPLELDGYLAIERRRPACGDPQHIWNKLLFDAANEALAAHYAQAVRSLSGRLAPRASLLDPAMLERHVTQHVLRWATLGSGDGALGDGEAAAGGGGGVPGLSALLAEDAAEEERLLGQLVDAMQAELAAAASRTASPEPAGAVPVAPPS